MEIVHNLKSNRNENSPFSVTFGDKASDHTLQSLEKNLLKQMGNVLSIVHGGAGRSRRTHVSA